MQTEPQVGVFLPVLEETAVGLRTELLWENRSPWGRISCKPGCSSGAEVSLEGLLLGGKGQRIQRASRELEFGCQWDRRPFGKHRIEFGEFRKNPWRVWRNPWWKGVRDKV